MKVGPGAMPTPLAVRATLSSASTLQMPMLVRESAESDHGQRQSSGPLPEPLPEPGALLDVTRLSTSRSQAANGSSSAVGQGEGLTEPR